MATARLAAGLADDVVVEFGDDFLGGHGGHGSGQSGSGALQTSASSYQIIAISADAVSVSMVWFMLV